MTQHRRPAPHPAARLAGAGGKAFAQMQLAVAALDPGLDPFSLVGNFLLRGVGERLRDVSDPQKLFYEAQKLKVRVNRLIESVERMTGARPGGRMQVEFIGSREIEAAIMQPVGGSSSPGRSRSGRSPGSQQAALDQKGDDAHEGAQQHALVAALADRPDLVALILESFQGSPRAYVPELLQERSGLPFHVGELLRAQVAAEAADRLCVRAGERVSHRRRRDSQMRGEGVVGLRQRLVADLERPFGRRPRRGDVAPPRPGRPRRLACLHELFHPLRLDPEARAGAVGKPRVVGSRPLGVQPAALEQRADDVPPVADDVHGARLRESAERVGEDE